MTRSYLLFAMVLFGLFCLLEYRGVAWDSNQSSPKPKYYSYTGGSSGGGYYGGSSRGYYSSHK